MLKGETMFCGGRSNDFNIGLTVDLTFPRNSLRGIGNQFLEADSVRLVCACVYATNVERTVQTAWTPSNIFEKETILNESLNQLNLNLFQQTKHGHGHHPIFSKRKRF